MEKKLEKTIPTIPNS